MFTKYNEVLDFLYANLPMFQRQGAAAMKKDLTNIHLLMDALGNPHEKFKSIHVGGTNGKGSSTHILSALFQSQGYSVGVYTSPHYKDFRERIKINAQLISEQDVISFVNQHLETINRVAPSFFEITVAMAFDYFAKMEVDVAIVEVGLGGRLDSTNIIRPVVSLITNISYDHQQFLGESLVEIAGEKAGIIKTNIPVVIGEKQNEVASVFLMKAMEKNSEITFAEDEVDVDFNTNTKAIVLRIKDHEIRTEVPWFVDYQIRNIKSALQSFWVYCNQEAVKINWKNIPEFLRFLPRNTYFLGRWMTLGESPKIIAESAHNQAGLEYLFQILAEHKYTHFHFVLGFSNDKDISEILQLFPKDASYYFAKADIPRGLDAQKLQLQAKKYGLKGRKYASVRHAFKAAKKWANPEDFIYVGGSIFVVAEVI